MPGSLNPELWMRSPTLRLTTSGFFRYSPSLLVIGLLRLAVETGNLTRHLLENAKEVTAIDIDAEYLRILSSTIRIPEGRANC